MSTGKHRSGRKPGEGICPACGKIRYRTRRDAFVEGLAGALPWAGVPPPAAGVTLWLPLPSRLSTQAAFDACAREGVLVMPSDPWYPTRTGRAALRLGFGDLDEATASEAILRLARGIRQQERFTARP